ncbi:MAG: endonuclease/exonuclease/phosphatase family protein [Sulfuriferula sp.]
MNTSLRVASYNIHKGFSHFNRRMVIHDLRARLRALNSDIVFLQEVQGSHLGHAQRWQYWPSAPQYEFLADQVWANYAYGKNAVYDQGHHGNAVLSRYPIAHWENLDISDHAFESRGLLHVVIDVPGLASQLHVFCVHLALFERSRKRQLELVCRRVREQVPDEAPLIIAGDFNDWRGRTGRDFAATLGLIEVYETVHGQVARSFPASLPILSLDRIYVRGWRVRQAEVVGRLDGWHRSDHAALVAVLDGSLSAV